MLLAASAIALHVPEARAQNAAQLERRLAGVEVVERLGEALPLDLPLTDELGRDVTLGSYTQRPILLSFNYSACSTLCSVQLAGLAKALRGVSPVPSKDFDIVTLSLDPKQPVEKSMRAKQTYVRQAGGTDSLGQGWHFLVAPEDSIRATADAAGFHYRYDEQNDEYVHKATLVVLTPDGKVSAYFHGISYDPGALSRAIRRAADGDIASADAGVVGFLLDCLSYDPTSRAPIAMLIVRLTGLIAFLSLAAFVGTHLVRENRRRKARLVA